MLTRDLLHHYQLDTVEFVKSTPYCAVWMRMGGGKTISTLTAITDLQDDLEVHKTLIVAPLRVANTVWRQEAAKWEHTKHLKVVICTGPEKERRLALSQEADVYVINRENVEWLVNYYGADWPFDHVVLDEASSFKSHKSKRWKALRKVRKNINRLNELTGSPASNGYGDLWAQIFLLDQGKRLHKTVTAFRERWFTSDYMGYNYTIKEGAEKEIQDRLADIVTVVDHYDGLPDVTVNDFRVELSSSEQAAYDQFEREQLLKMVDAEIEALNAAALTNKLLQYANGAVYDENKKAHSIHDRKIEALKEIVEDAQGDPILVAYSYKSDLERLKKAFPKAVVLGREGKEVGDWNAGRIPILLAHPASAGHGLNLQQGGRIIVWFGLTWSLELYEQMNARLARQGQQNPVFVHRLITSGTMDEVVIQALESKDKNQSALIDAVKNKIQQVVAIN